MMVAVMAFVANGKLQCLPALNPHHGPQRTQTGPVGSLTTTAVLRFVGMCAVVLLKRRVHGPESYSTN